MKKAIIACMAVLLALSVCACSFSESAPTYTMGAYTVDQENGTISDGTNVYRYTFSGNASGYGIQITYPDGSTYRWSQQTNSGGTGFGYGSWSDDYDGNGYVRGDVLCDILAAKAPRAREPLNPLCFVLLAIGLFNALSPQTAWFLSSGWKYKDAEPSELALGVTRAGGIACCLIGVLMIFAR